MALHEVDPFLSGAALIHGSVHLVGRQQFSLLLFFLFLLFLLSFKPIGEILLDMFSLFDVLELSYNAESDKVLQSLLVRLLPLDLHFFESFFNLNFQHLHVVN